MLLYTYLGTTLISIIAVILNYNLTLKKELKRNNYVFVKGRRLFFKKILFFLRFYSNFLIPIRNIILTYIFLNYNEIYLNILEEHFIEQGFIISKNQDSQEIDISDDIYEIVIIDDNITKKYKEMTREEQIAHFYILKEMLLESDEEKTNDEQKIKKIGRKNNWR